MKIVEIKGLSKSAINSFRIVKDLTEFPETYGGKPLDTYVNLKWLLNFFNADIKYNLMSRRREIEIPNHSIFKDDNDNAAIARVNYLSTINGMPTKQLDRHLDVIAFENPYHPIVEMLKKNVWDNTPRLDDFISTIETTNKKLSYQLIKTWMVAAIAAAHSEDGFVNQGVLVLQGKQNLGKTRWVKSLDPINCGAVKEGAILDPSNRDNIVMLARHWIVELGELDATFRKADIARLKSFITTQADDVRFAYAPRDTRLARRSAYIATVNDEKFLADDTGNRRWWTIDVNKINNNHNLNMTQVWAEVLHIWKNGHLTYLTHEIQDSVDAFNVHHEKSDHMQELLLANYDWDSSARRFAGATRILEELGIRIDNSTTSKMGVLLKKMSNNNFKTLNGYRQYSLPLKLFKSS